ncbi:MAG TPA: D-glycero-beta-D-manno-heptose-7-phosphate kinase [Burkholderiales bacterium]|nr:D-glycero-beta-D-manno-heptose-7-phosphate kinase [Burkholderiales bacterium]
MTINAKIIEQIKNDLGAYKILVVGDVMLDRYWFGDVNRISPEAPVPIARIHKTEERPGGAANVALNIASLGGNVTLLSVVGNDEPAKTLKNILNKANIKVVFKKDNSISTIIKLRVMAKNQQLIRIDFEENPSHEILNEILDEFENIIKDYEIIILSDYGKGGLKHIEKLIHIAKAHKKRILVDPKGFDYQKYSGATIITPNKTELQHAIGFWKNEQELVKKVLAFKNKLKLDYILLTRSEEGMSLFINEKIKNYPAKAQEVYDVSGAGDTVIATLGLMLANNISIEDSVMLANFAAGIVVGKLGTATVTKNELLNAL